MGPVDIGRANASDKHGADHVASDEDIKLETRQPVTVFFTEGMPISLKAAVVPGVSEAKSIDEANRMLIDKQIDVFGRELVTDREGVRSYKGRPDVFDWVNVHIKTSNNNVFSAKCYPSDGWS